MKLSKFASAVVALLVTSCALSAWAVPIADIYNTGVNNAGVTLPHPATDPHYRIIVSPTGPSPALTVSDVGFPIPPWIANVYGAGGSRWIGQNFGGGGSIGGYLYRTTFTLPANADLNSVNIMGEWASDDLGSDILINGNSTSQTNVGFTAYAPFAVSGSGLFAIGTNTLDFRLGNALSVTGLRVNRIKGTFNLIPEPGSMTLMLISCLGITSFWMRRRS